MQATWAPLTEAFTGDTGLQVMQHTAGQTPDTSTQQFASSVLQDLGDAADVSDPSAQADALAILLAIALEVAHRSMDGEEISELNRYVGSIQDVELKRISGLRRTFISSLNVSKQLYLMHTAWAQRMAAIIRMSLYGLLAAAIAAALAPSAAEGSGISAALIAVCFFAYGVLVMVFIAAANRRRKDDWGKVYWTTTETSGGGSSGVRKQESGGQECDLGSQGLASEV
jgi:hypothetical protein